MAKEPRFVTTYELYPKLALGRGQHLPDEGFDWRELNMLSNGYAYFPLRCSARNAQGGRKHRLIVKCRCDREIPFGRLSQHRKACHMLRRCTVV